MEQLASPPMKLSEGAKNVMVMARAEAFRMKNKVITPGHLFVGFILEGSEAGILAKRPSSLDEFRKAAQETSWDLDKNIKRDEIRPNTDIVRALQISSEMATQEGSLSISTKHLLKAILWDGLLRDPRRGEGIAEVIIKSMIGDVPGRLLVESGAMTEEEVRRRVKALIDSEPEGLTEQTLRRQHGPYQF